MILRKANVSSESRTGEGWGTVETTRIGDAGGLTQFGVSIQTLLPGARASLAHWHEKTDEMLYVLSGELTVIENDVAQVLVAGDAACWPAGVAVAHTVANRSASPCSYVVVGTRSTQDVCHYEEIGETMHTDGDQWKIVDRGGRVLREGRAGENPWR